MQNLITKKDLEIGYEHLKVIIDAFIKDNDISFISSDLAPNTFKDMKGYYEDFNQFLVYSGGDHGFLGQEYNVKFRALHDFMHLDNNLTFKFEDEKKLSDITKVEFSQIAWDDMYCTAWECHVIREIVNAEIRGQIEYYEVNKEYVVNQTKFIEDYLQV